MIPEFLAYHRDLQIIATVLRLDWILNVVWVDWAYEEVENKWPFKDIKLLQYTGLKDTQGKKVYDGDMIITKSKKHEWKGHMFIRQNIAAGRWELVPAVDCAKNVRIFSSDNISEQRLEVFGNVYLHPELLVGGKVPYDSI